MTTDTDTTDPKEGKQMFPNLINVWTTDNEHGSTLSFVELVGYFGGRYESHLFIHHAPSGNIWKGTF